jgi:hypothetical protein
MARPQQSWAQWAYTGRQAGRQAGSVWEREREGGAGSTKGRSVCARPIRGFAPRQGKGKERCLPQRSSLPWEAATLTLGGTGRGRVGPGRGWG